MCRYVFLGPYKDRYACFACRKAFKRRKSDDLPGRMLRSGKHAGPVRCPQCRGEMHDMGMDFKAPRQKDVERWAIVEKLFRCGFTFHTCGCCGAGPLPTKLSEINAFLRDWLRREIGFGGVTKSAASRRGRPARVAQQVTGRTWGPAAPVRQRADGRPRVGPREPVQPKPTTVFSGPARKRGKKRKG